MAPVSNRGLRPQPRITNVKVPTSAELRASLPPPAEGKPGSAGWVPKAKADPALLQAAQGPSSATAVSATDAWSAEDLHLPSLDEAFTLAEKYPGKTIFLDTKLPKNKPEVAQRMAQQYLEAFRAHPKLKDQAFIAVPNAEMLEVIKQEFENSPDFKDFKNFCLDHEELNQSFFKSARKVRANADPLRGSDDNRFIAVGDPKSPLKQGSFNDLKQLVSETLVKTRDPASPEFGKKLSVWTINDEKKMKELAALKPDFILTDNPALLNKVLDELFAADEPNRPRVMAHRGGPAGFAPMNTMPLLEEGFRSSDAIEIDICSAKDGAILFHDNNPKDIITALHAQAIDQPGFRIELPNIGTKARTRRIDELTADEVRNAYRYTDAKKPKGIGKAALGVTRTAGSIGNWAATNAQKGIEKLLGLFKKREQ